MLYAFISNVLEKFSFVGQLMVDAFNSITSEKLVGLAEDELKLLWGIREEVVKLSDTLNMIQPYLLDLEVRQYFEDTENPKAEDWLQELKYVAYEADDVLDEWQTKSQQSSSQQLSTDTNQVKNIFDPSTWFHPLHLSHSVGKKIKEINDNLDHIFARGKKLGFLKSSSEVTMILTEEINFPGVIRDARKTTSSVGEIFGREDEINGIKDNLINSSEKSKLAVVSIVGPPGFGKTALAKHVFNDGEIVQHFKERIWVCVSDEFDEASIMRNIIEAATKKAASAVGLEALQNKIVDEVLKDKLFLLVLDDVWNEDYGKWEKLFNVIKNCGLRGSQIVVTTRSEKVCQVIGGHKFPLRKISSFKHCWSIFESVAFENRDESERQNLRTVGEEIVEKCKGVPLAIKTVASALRTKSTREAWDNVLKSDMWDWQPKSEMGICPALLLSYFHLSPQLKQCFRYCAIYPKDYRIRKDKTVQQWIAHGYISEKKNKELEDVGENCFDELVARSLFQEPELDKCNNITHCKMHDLVHDLAQFVTKGEFLHIKNEKNIEFDAQYPPLHCKVSNMDKIDVGKFLKLRTFMSTSYKREVCMCDNQIEEMPHLRVLKLKYWRRLELPDVVGKLMHLRYLYLSGETLKALPRSIGKLQNLYYLYFSSTSIEALPESVGMLRKLRHLDLSWNKNLKALPSTIGELINLRKLNLNETGLDEIPSSIGELQNLLYLDLTRNENLKALPNTIGRLTNLKKLDLESTRLDEIPSSIGELQNLLYLNLSRNKNLKALPSTIRSLTNLRKLKLNDTDLDEIPDCIGKLASLQVLDVSFCQKLEKLPESIVDLSRLQVLNVHLCTKLKQLPAGIFDKLTGLKELHVLGGNPHGLPAGIGKLTQLQRLDEFRVLGSHEDEEGSSSSSSSSSSNICELRDLNHLHGSLTISNLGMVTSGEEAASARLHNKNFLTSCLRLEWNIEGAKEEKTSEDVLQALRPCPTLRELRIDGYPGRKVPTYLWDSTPLMLSGLQELRLQNCNGCTNLPALGNLPELRLLDIWGMPKVRRVGTEWFGSNHAFPKLEYLQFENMAEWEEWDSLVEEKLFFPFPCLSKLKISDCPRLRSLPPIFSTSQLREIDVTCCPNLSNWLGILSASIVTLGSISAEWVNGLPSLPNLEELTISGDDGTVSELSNHLVQMGALKTLQICPNLESLPQEMASMTQLRTLVIWRCPKLKESRNKEGAQWYKIEHIQTLRLTVKLFDGMPEYVSVVQRWITNETSFHFSSSLCANQYHLLCFP